MAMNKKEQAAMIKPDLPPPVASGVMHIGFAFDAQAMTVSHKWSRNDRHGKMKTEYIPSTNGIKDGSIHLYTSKSLALHAMRAAVEYVAAQKLDQIDAMIEAEEGK